jgi:hypothetical protein
MDYFVEDKQLVKLFVEKEKELKKGRALHKKVRKLQLEQQKIGLKLNRYKEQMSVLAEKQRKALGMDEFEDLRGLDYKKGKLVLRTVNLIDEFKEEFRKANNKTDESKTKGSDKADGKSKKR